MKYIAISTSTAELNEATTLREYKLTKFPWVYYMTLRCIWICYFKTGEVPVPIGVCVSSVGVKDTVNDEEAKVPQQEHSQYERWTPQQLLGTLPFPYRTAAPRRTGEAWRRTLTHVLLEQGSMLIGARAGRYSYIFWKILRLQYNSLLAIFASHFHFHWEKY